MKKKKQERKKERKREREKGRRTFLLFLNKIPLHRSLEQISNPDARSISLCFAFTVVFCSSIIHPTHNYYHYCCCLKKVIKCNAASCRYAGTHVRRHTSCCVRFR